MLCTASGAIEVAVFVEGRPFLGDREDCEWLPRRGTFGEISVSGMAGFVHEAAFTWDAGKVRLELLYEDEKEASANLSLQFQKSDSLDRVGATRAVFIFCISFSRFPIDCIALLLQPNSNQRSHVSGHSSHVISAPGTSSPVVNLAPWPFLSQSSKLSNVLQGAERESEFA
jgi:hypothetical protein